MYYYKQLPFQFLIIYEHDRYVWMLKFYLRLLYKLFAWIYSDFFL